MLLTFKSDIINAESSGLTSRQLQDAVLPVFLFDFSHDNTWLLDRKHQAVAFDDMVIAVQSKTPLLQSDFFCRRGNAHHGYAAQRVLLPARDATRAVLGAVLQSVWDVAPTHESRQRAARSPSTSLLWSADGTNPFGPFALLAPVTPAESLSFALRDVIRYLFVVFLFIFLKKHQWFFSCFLKIGLCSSSNYFFCQSNN